MAIRFGRSVTWKGLTIGFIVLLLLVPLSMLESLVSERAGLRERTYQRVAQGWGGELVLGGPILIVPTERTYEDGDKRRVVRSDVYLLPDSLAIDVSLELEAEPRRVGIYEVPVYLSNARMQGRFELAASSLHLDRTDTVYLWQQSRLLLPLSQVSSLREVKSAQLAGQSVRFGPAGPNVLSGVETPVDLTAFAAGQSAQFELAVVVAGSRALSFLPLGSETQVEMTSNWPHPSFQGTFLPATRTISRDGFSARWQVLELNRPYRQVWTEGEVTDGTLMSSAFGVGIYQAVDVYQRGERAVKYALLFIALTFLTFFAWEQLSRIQLHPLQYLLVGLALSTFYLLLIALSEHVAFWLAYAIAAAALVALIGAYIAGAMASRRAGVVSGTAMALTYGVLYVLVLSEDYALLLGAIVLFAALAAVMLATRRIDWYRLSSDGDA